MVNVFRFISNFILRKHIHLRDLLAFGIEVEQRAEEFYTSLGDKTQNVTVRGIAYKLAREERKHREEMEDILERWRKLDKPLADETRVFLETELIKKGLFFGDAPNILTEQELIKYAIDQEEKMIKYYRAFRRRFPEAWKKSTIDGIIEEEKVHIKQLKEQYNR